MIFVSENSQKNNLDADVKIIRIKHIWRISDMKNHADAYA
jgi:hypothetical protein